MKPSAASASLPLVFLFVLLVGCGSDAGPVQDDAENGEPVTIASSPDTTTESSRSVVSPCADLEPQHIGDGLSGVLPESAVLVSGEQTTGDGAAPAAAARKFDIDGASVSVGRRLQSSLSYESGFDERDDGDVVLFVKADDPMLRACIADSLTYDAMLDEQD